jgi:hypothetical protein
MTATNFLRFRGEGCYLPLRRRNLFKGKSKHYLFIKEHICLTIRVLFLSFASSVGNSAVLPTVDSEGESFSALSLS